MRKRSPLKICSEKLVATDGYLLKFSTLNEAAIANLFNATT